MTAFVDEQRENYGGRADLRRVADRPVYLLGAQTAGAGTGALPGPSPGATPSCVLRFVECGSRTSGCTEYARCGASFSVKVWRWLAAPWSA